eukprot:92985-Rhodomonas_salina.1
MAQITMKADCSDRESAVAALARKLTDLEKRERGAEEGGKRGGVRKGGRVEEGEKEREREKEKESRWEELHQAMAKWVPLSAYVYAKVR